MLSNVVGSVPLVLMPLAPASFPIPFLVVSMTLVGFGIVLYNVSGISLTQLLTPERLLGRVNASRRFIVWGTIPIGGLVSGGLASWIGLRPTMFVGSIGCILAVVPIALSPVRHVKEIPTEPEEVPFGQDALLPTQAAGLTPEGPAS